MNALAVEKVEFWIQEKLLPAQDARFDVAKEVTDVVLSAICETAFDYKMSRDERDWFRIELEYALVSRFY